LAPQLSKISAVGGFFGGGRGLGDPAEHEVRACPARQQEVDDESLACGTCHRQHAVEAPPRHLTTTRHRLRPARPRDEREPPGEEITPLTGYLDRDKPGGWEPLFTHR